MGKQRDINYSSFWKSILTVVLKAFHHLHWDYQQINVIAISFGSRLNCGHSKRLQRSSSRMVGTLESRSTAIKVVEAGAMMALNITSLLGNILVCLSVYRNNRLRTTTNLYIIALAVTDLIAATLVMPPATGVLITGRWPFGETACQIHAYFGLLRCMFRL